MPAEDPDAPTVLAAGGVVVRTRDGRQEVAVIHRPKYDDWSLPKGKLEGAETFEAAALREVEEETGHRCELVREVGETRYRDSKGRPKLARYWLMRPLGGEFRPHDEVDDLRWLPSDEAVRALTHPRDRDLVLRALSS